MRGLLGLEVSDEGNSLRFAPQLPADWDRVEVRRVAAGARRVSITLRRTPTETRITVRQESGGGAQAGARYAPLKLTLAPSFPLDARVQAVTVGPPLVASDTTLNRKRPRPSDFGVTREGDVQRAAATAATGERELELSSRTPRDGRLRPHEAPAAGARSQGLRGRGRGVRGERWL